jgi:CRP-like cAMP-binding protein
VVDLLTLAAGAPRRTAERGEVLLTDGEVVGSLFVLVDGALRVEKGGVPIATVTDPGACVGEMSILLGVAATADVVVTERATLAVLDDPGAMLGRGPDLPLALAQLLARRLQVMTTYLADLKQQYAGHEGGLGMIDTVLSTLSASPGPRRQLGSDRDPEPEY